jgi:hypothetical protein
VPISEPQALQNGMKSSSLGHEFPARVAEQANGRNEISVSQWEGIGS